jgi:protein SCO1/2
VSRIHLPRKGAALVAAAALGAAVGVTVGFARLPQTHHPALRARVQWAAGAKRAPELNLRDERSRPFRLADARGRVVALTFLDSRCRSMCPIEARQLATVWRSLSARRATLVVISTDPWGDTPASERRFAAKAHWSMPWHWLSGSAAQLRPVWRAYGVGVIRTPGDVSHGTALYLIDGNGFERGGYLPPFLPRDVAHDIGALGAT